MNVDGEGALTGTAREEAMRAERMTTAEEKKRIVRLAVGYAICLPTSAFYTFCASVRHGRLLYPWEIENR